jgi:hypothetical protein
MELNATELLDCEKPKNETEASKQILESNTKVYLEYDKGSAGLHIISEM